MRRFLRTSIRSHHCGQSVPSSGFVDLDLVRFQWSYVISSAGFLPRSSSQTLHSRAVLGCARSRSTWRDVGSPRSSHFFLVAYQLCWCNLHLSRRRNGKGGTKPTKEGLWLTHFGNGSLVQFALCWSSFSVSSSKIPSNLLDLQIVQNGFSTFLQWPHMAWGGGRQWTHRQKLMIWIVPLKCECECPLKLKFIEIHLSCRLKHIETTRVKGVTLKPIKIKMSDNGNSDGKSKGEKKNGKSHHKKSRGIPSHWVGKEKECSNNVCVFGHKLHSELCIEWVTKSPEMMWMVE